MLCPDALLFALEWQCSGSKVKSKPVIHTNSDRPDAWDQKAIAVCLCRVCCKLDLAVASQKTPQVWSPRSTQNHSNAVDLTEWFQSQVLQVAWMLTPKNLIYRCDTEWCLKVLWLTQCNTCCRPAGEVNHYNSIQVQGQLASVCVWNCIPVLFDAFTF